MKKHEALQPFEAIKAQLEQIAESLGLTLEAFALLIEDDQELTAFQCQFTIRAEAVMSEAEREQAKFDAEFQRIEEQEREREIHEQKLPKIQKDIDDWLSED